MAFPGAPAGMSAPADFMSQMAAAIGAAIGQAKGKAKAKARGGAGAGGREGRGDKISPAYKVYGDLKECHYKEGAKAMSATFYHDFVIQNLGLDTLGCIFEFGTGSALYESIPNNLRDRVRLVEACVTAHNARNRCLDGTHPAQVQAIVLEMRHRRQHWNDTVLARARIEYMQQEQAFFATINDQGEKTSILPRVDPGIHDETWA